MQNPVNPCKLKHFWQKSQLLRLIRRICLKQPEIFPNSLITKDYRHLRLRGIKASDVNIRMRVRPRFTARRSQGIVCVQGGPDCSQRAELSFTLIRLVVDSCRWCDCNLKRLCGAHLSPLHSSPGASRQHFSIVSCEKWAHTVMQRVSSANQHSMNMHKHEGGWGLWTTHALFCQLNGLRMTHECQYNHNIGNPFVEAVLNFHEVTYPQRGLANSHVGETTRRIKSRASSGCPCDSVWGSLSGTL